MLLFALCLLVGCQKSKNEASPVPNKNVAKIVLTSVAFKEGELIPSRYTCDGENLSPPLQWSGAPSGTKSLALICEDPDAPSGTFTHWVLFNLSSTATELKEGQPAKAHLDNADQDSNDFGKIGYGGPCPPPGKPHRYIFHLYALKRYFLVKNTKKQDIQQRMQPYIIAEGQLMGTYQRK